MNDYMLVARVDGVVVITAITLVVTASCVRASTLL